MIYLDTTLTPMTEEKPVLAELLGQLERANFRLDHLPCHGRDVLRPSPGRRHGSARGSHPPSASSFDHLQMRWDVCRGLPR